MKEHMKELLNLVVMVLILIYHQIIIILIKNLLIYGTN